MLPDFGWTELLVIAIVLIVVVGPKDLPKMLRTFGKTAGNLRRMAGDFRKQFDEALKEAELEDVRSLAKDVKGLDPRNEIKSALNPLGKAGQDLNDDLKRATRDLGEAEKPKSAADNALQNAGDKARAAQAKAEKLPEPERGAKAGARPASTAADKPASSKTAAKSGSNKGNGAAGGASAGKPAPRKAASKKAAAGARKTTPAGKRKPAGAGSKS